MQQKVHPAWIEEGSDPAVICYCYLFGHATWQSQTSYLPTSSSFTWAALSEKMYSKGKCAVCLDRMESRPHDSRIRCQECEVHLSCETREHSNKSCFAVFHTIEHFRTVRKRTTFKHSQRQKPSRKRTRMDEEWQGWLFVSPFIQIGNLSNSCHGNMVLHNQ